MRERLRIVVVTSKLPEDIWLINRLADVSEISGIVFPTGKRYREYGTWHIVKKRMRQGDFVRLADQTLLFAYRLLLERRRDARAARELLVGKPSTHVENKNIEILQVDDANSSLVADYIRSKEPEVVVVSNAPLLKKRIREAAKGKIINLHPGLAPQYRGRYCSFWPLYNGEPENVGTTIHYIDRGIDTGRILIQESVEFDPKDSVRAITLRQHKVGVDLLEKCLQDFDRFAALAYRRTACADRNYLAPGLFDYLKGRRRFNAGIRADKRPKGFG